MNIEGFKKRLTENLQEIMSELDHHEVTGVALCSDESARSITFAFNTKEHLLDCHREDPDEDLEYYRWYPAEWFKDSYRNENLNILSNDLFNRDYSKNTKYEIFNAVVGILSQSKEIKSLACKTEEFVCVFHVSDSEDLESQFTWIERLNSKELYAEYTQWMKTLDI